MPPSNHPQTSAVWPTQTYLLNNASNQEINIFHNRDWRLLGWAVSVIDCTARPYLSKENSIK